MKSVVSYWNLILYCVPVAPGAVVLPRRSSRAMQAACHVGCRSSVVGQARSEVMTLRNLWTASSWVPCAQGVSCRGFTGKLGDTGCCGRRGLRQSRGPVVSLQPTRMDLPYSSKAMTDVFVKRTWQPASTKRVTPMRLWGKLAMTWPIRLDAGRLGTNASSALAIDHTGVPLATWTSIEGAVAS
jgi:hypothetical protein